MSLIHWLKQQFPRRVFVIEAKTEGKWKRLSGQYPLYKTASDSRWELHRCAVLGEDVPGRFRYHPYEDTRVTSLISWPRLIIERSRGIAEILLGRYGYEAVWELRYKYTCPNCDDWWKYVDDMDPYYRYCPWCKNDEKVWPWTYYWFKLKRKLGGIR